MINEFIERVKNNKDDDSLIQLVNIYKSICYRLLDTYTIVEIPDEDKESMTYLSVYKCALQFNPEIGTEFLSLLYWYVRSILNNYIFDNYSSGMVPNHMVERFSALYRTPQNMLNVSEYNYLKDLVIPEQLKQLNPNKYIYYIEDHIEKKDIKQLFVDIIYNDLPTRVKDLAKLYYIDEYSLADASRLLNFSRQRGHQIITKIRLYFKHVLNAINKNESYLSYKNFVKTLNKKQKRRFL